MEYTCRWLSPLGEITLASDGEAITGLWFDGQKHYAQPLDPEHEERSLSVFTRATSWLETYFRGGDPGDPPPLRPRLSPFRQMVCDIMLTIPRGSTMTYGQIAERCEQLTGRRCSPRAVGGAVGRNPVSLMIPCHRVVGKSGSLTGYAGGVERKEALLRLEGVKL